MFYYKYCRNRADRGIWEKQVSFEQIRASLALSSISGVVREPPSTKLLFANWLPFEERFELKTFFGDLEKHTFPSSLRLFVPLSLVGFAKEQLGGRLHVGSNSSLTCRTFSKEIFLSLFEEEGVDCLFVDLARRGNLQVSDAEALREKVSAFTEEKISMCVRVGESHSDFVEGRSVDVLEEQLDLLFGDGDLKSPEHLFLVYAPSWVLEEGFDNLTANVDKSYGLLFSCLEKRLSEESLQSLALFFSVPYLDADIAVPLLESPYKGIFFPNLFVQKETFFKLLAQTV